MMSKSAALPCEMLAAESLEETVAETQRKILLERYTALLEEHGPALRRAAGSYASDPARAEDLLQDILLAIWQALPRFRGECSERTFAFRIAHNRGISHTWRGRPKGKPMALEDVAEVHDPRPGPEARAVGRQSRARLEAALRRLPVTARQVLILSLEGLSHAEIGDVLGLSVTNVGVRVHRARRALAREMGGGGDR